MRINKQLRILFIIIFCHNFSGAFCQIRFTGQVYDRQSGQALSDVNILERISGYRAVSDTSGRFLIITSSELLKLQFAKIGYEVTKGEYTFKNDTVRIFMNPTSIEIEEIHINTGYQWIPKERVTGSFVHITQQQLAAVPSRSIIEKLDGIMPGIQFDNRRVSPVSGSAPVITVRGMNAFSTNGSRPLIVVDNFPYEGDIENINPNDVESVTLMRDAAATSIWGVRAGNGVLVINLKKPDQSGRAAVSWSSNLSIIPKPDLFYLPIMSSREFVDVELFLYDKGHYRTALTGSNAHQTVFSPVVQGLYDMSLGNIDQHALDQIIGRAQNHNYMDDMYDHFYRNAVNQQHHFSLSKRTGNHSLRFSAGIDRLVGQGNLSSDGTDNRYSFNLSNSYQLSKKLQTELSVYYSINMNKSGWDISYPLNPGGGKTSMYPYIQLIDDQGNGLMAPNALNPRYVDTVGHGVLLDWKYNPFEEMSLVQKESSRSKIQPVLTIRYSPIQHLHLEAIYSGDFQYAKNAIDHGKDSYYVRDMVNRYTQINGTQVLRPLPVGSILNYSNSDLTGHNLRFLAKTDKRVFGNDRLSWVVGGEISDVFRESSSGRVYGYNAFLRSSTAVDYVLQQPLFLGGRNSIPYGQSMGFNLRRVVSLFTNFSYALHDKYILSASARRDASNVFGVKSNQRWNPLWSVGLAWNLNKETFIQDVEWISSLKLRVTSGHSGNLGYGTTSDRVVINTTSTQSMTGLPAMIISTPPNPSLKWENIQMNNFGIDFGFLNDGVMGNIEYYRKRVTDLISNDPMDGTTGFNNMDRNVGRIDGEGLDMAINLSPFSGRFTWKFGTSFSYVRDWVTTYYGSAPNVVQLTGGEMTVIPVKGKPLVPIYSYRFAGLDPQTGDPQGFLNGEVSKNYTAMLNDSLHNLIFHGSARPLYSGFINNTFQYRNLSLFLNISYRAGHYFRKNTIKYNALFNSWTTHSDYSKRWKQPGDELYTTVPSMSYPASSSRDNFYAGTDTNVERGDVIRLQQIRLSYRGIKPIWKIKGMDVGLHANNLGILWKASKKERDPDYQAIPPARMISMNLSLQF